MLDPHGPAGPVVGREPGGAMASETKYTFCRLCEGICGLEVTLRDGRIEGIAPDRDNPLSRGFACLKGTKAAEILYSPARVLHPMRRRGDGWETAGWDGAMADIGRRLRRIVEETGPDSVALYLGNPSAMSAVTFYLAGAFMQALGSSRRYSSMTLDNMSKFYVAEEMFGDKSLILQRDWANADYMLVLGHNPLVSIFGQLSSRPRGLADIRAAQGRGGRLVLVDPRRTETAALADRHLRIAPGTDAYFLLALVNTIIAEDLYDRAWVERHCENFDALRSAVARFTPESVADATGIEAAAARGIARDFALRARQHRADPTAAGDGGRVGDCGAERDHRQHRPRRRGLLQPRGRRRAAAEAVYRPGPAFSDRRLPAADGRISNGDARR